MQRIMRIFSVALAGVLLIAAPPANGQLKLCLERIFSKI